MTKSPGGIYVIYRVTMDIAVPSREATKPHGTATLGHWEVTEADLLGWTETRLSTREMVWDKAASSWEEAPADQPQVDLAAAGEKLLQSLKADSISLGEAQG
jgi:hypothetical protein